MPGIKLKATEWDVIAALEELLQDLSARVGVLERMRKRQGRP